MNSTQLNRVLLGAGAALAALACLPAAGLGAERYVPGEVIVATDDGGSRVVELEPGTPVRAAVAELNGEPGVRAAAPNWVARASLVPFDQGTAGTPGGWAADQWSLGGRPGGIRAPAAWDRLAALGAPGGFGVTVAIVDTGVAYEAASGFAPSPDFLGTQFVPGIDLVDDDSQPLDLNGHGTHVASTIGEQITVGQPADHPDYLAGIAYGASLMPVRVLDEDGVGSTDDVAAGIEWAAQSGADVINVSLNLDPAVDGCRDVPTICAAVRRADKLGALVVGSAGNAIDTPGRKRALYPAAAPRAFAAAATTEDGCLAEYSHYGKRTDIVAPGGGAPRPAASHGPCADDSIPIVQLTYACFPMDCSRDRQTFAIRPDIGTSMSAAHTSAVAALVIASGISGEDPAPNLVARRLQCTAKPLKPARFYGPGLLDAKRAVDPKRTCDS